MSTSGSGNLAGVNHSWYWSTTISTIHVHTHERFRVISLSNLHVFGQGKEVRAPWGNSQTQEQFTQHKFLHQMKHFCCYSAFHLHDNSMLVPLKPQMFKTGFKSGIFWNHNLLCSCVNWQAKLCKHRDNANANASTSAMHSALAITKLWLNTPQCTESRSNVTTVYWFECSYTNFRSQTTAEFL